MADEAGASMSETETPETKAETSEAKTPETPAPQSFTTADVERIVKERLFRERQKYEGFDEMKTKAGAYDELKESQKTELEKAQARAEQAEQAAAKVREAADRRLIEASVLAEATRQRAVKPEHLHKLIDTDQVTIGDDGQVTGAEDAVKAFLEANPEYVGNGRASGSADQGARAGGANQLSRADLKNMSPEAIVQARKDGRLTSIAGGS